jgi:hypothetical protein
LKLAAGDLQRQHDALTGRFPGGPFRPFPLYLRHAVLNPGAGHRRHDGRGRQPADDRSANTRSADFDTRGIRL